MFLDVGHISFGVRRFIVLRVMLLVLVDGLLSLDLFLNPKPIDIVVVDVVNPVQVYTVYGVLYVAEMFNLALVVQNSLVGIY